jgi:hypothetical protein
MIIYENQGRFVRIEQKISIIVTYDDNRNILARLLLQFDYWFVKSCLYQRLVLIASAIIRKRNNYSASEFTEL